MTFDDVCFSSTLEDHHKLPMSKKTVFCIYPWTSKELLREGTEPLKPPKDPILGLEGFQTHPSSCKTNPFTFPFLRAFVLKKELLFPFCWSHT